MKPSRVLPALLLALAACAHGARVAPAPASGEALVRQMHDRYAGRWFRTLTFVQRTTMHRPDGSTSQQTWLEALQAPSRLRIDIGPLDSANGIIFTADSTYRITGGTLARAVARGNPLLPFVSGVFAQPVERTLAELATEHYDMSRIRADQWQGRPVWVVGAAAGDSASSQFWVDQERLVPVRQILATPNGPEDIRFDDYRQFGQSWVALHVAILVGGRELQSEDYTEVTIDRDLDPALFDPHRWTAARHWSR